MPLPLHHKLDSNVVQWQLLLGATLSRKVLAALIREGTIGPFWSCVRVRVRADVCACVWGRATATVKASGAASMSSTASMWRRATFASSRDGERNNSDTRQKICTSLGFARRSASVP
eukprot:5564213-Amphidinium_carterae.1